jgi:PRC-barrel domain
MRSPKGLSASEVNIPSFKAPAFETSKKELRNNWGLASVASAELRLSHSLFRWSIYMLQKLAIGVAVAAAISASAFAQQSTTTGVATSHADILSNIPSTATTVTNYYKQNLYDPSDSKIGEIVDVLVGNDGRIAAFIVSVGGFLGMDSKDVAVPFNAVHATQKNGSWYLTMNATKDALKGAPGYKYDKAKANWVPA